MPARELANTPIWVLNDYLRKIHSIQNELKSIMITAASFIWMKEEMQKEIIDEMNAEGREERRKQAAPTSMEELRGRLGDFGMAIETG